MDRKRLAFALFAFLLLAAALGFLVARLGRTEINRDNFECVAIGMSQAEMEAILGAPRIEGPEEFRDYAMIWFAVDGFLSIRMRGKNCWASPGGLIQVKFDEGGKVSEASWDNAQVPTWLDRLRGRLHL